jgi:hypothetical protein
MREAPEMETINVSIVSEPDLIPRFNLKQWDPLLGSIIVDITLIGR